MGLAKHHEEILQKILDNFDSLKNDADLSRLIADYRSVWNPRKAVFEDLPIDPNGPKYDLSRVSLNLIKNLHEANLLHAKKIAKLENALKQKDALIDEASKKLQRSREVMREECGKKIAALKKQLSEKGN